MDECPLLALAVKQNLVRRRSIRATIWRHGRFAGIKQMTLPCEGWNHITDYQAARGTLA